MEWLKNRKNRLLVSIFAAMAVAMLVAGGTGYGHGSRPLAWWGTMYPKFCFAESREEAVSYTHLDVYKRQKQSSLMCYNCRKFL